MIDKTGAEFLKEPAYRSVRDESKPNDYEGPWHQYHVEKTRFLRANTESGVRELTSEYALLKELETNEASK